MARVDLTLTDDDDEVTAVPSGTKPRLLMPDQMQPNPKNPRPPTDKEIEETAQDLADNGQLQNINVMSRAAFVRQMPHLADQLTSAPYVVINGCRRLAAATKNGIGLKYDLHDEWTAPQIRENALRENIHRLALHPLYEGRALAEMLPDYEGSTRKLGKALGKTHGWVGQRINLTKLRPELQEAHEAGRVSFTLARECIRLHEDLQLPLAAGELPDEVASDWVVEHRLSKAEQWKRWTAGPPYLLGPTPPPPPPEEEEAVRTPEPERQPAPVPSSGSTPVPELSAAADEPERQEQVPSRADADDHDETVVPPTGHTMASPQGIMINIPERSTGQLATALKEQLSADELQELITALTVS